MALPPTQFPPLRLQTGKIATTLDSATFPPSSSLLALLPNHLNHITSPMLTPPPSPLSLLPYPTPDSPLQSPLQSSMLSSGNDTVLCSWTCLKYINPKKSPRKLRLKLFHPLYPYLHGKSFIAFTNS
ncbi:hypothetical protein Fot_20075 [Forsythia ovata]|uniref:Uncharacterized protein n=1 Tax=Forsythia ovata TaxID=205694 RepID=A0ABD1VMV4_9LAMI